MLRSRTALRATLLVAIMTMLFTSLTPGARAAPRATYFKLANGMEVVVIPDTRAPVVTHMVWYRVGAADEPPGISGIAHFLEHLMFKGTDKIKPGEYSKIVSRLGGQDNAFTGHDATAYHQRVAKDRLLTMMEMEADRMANLRLDEKEVLTERNVILEERRSRVDASPQSILDEEMSAALYQNHPYGLPVIGWEHEIASLSREDALKFYKRYYAPNNAVLVVSGDVTPEQVKDMAERTYGKIPANPEMTPVRRRVNEPPHRSPRRLELKDPRAGRYSVSRYYIVPSYKTAPPGEAEAIDLLFKITGSGTTSRLYKRLVMEEKIASSAGGWYSGSGMDSGKIAVYGIAADGVSLDKVEASIDKVLAEVRDGGVTPEELERAKKLYLAEYVYQADSQVSLARRYGWALVTGETVKDVEEWPDRIAKVTVEDIKKVAKTLFDIRKSVTGRMLPEQPDGPRAEQPISRRS